MHTNSRDALVRAERRVLAARRGAAPFYSILLAALGKLALPTLLLLSMGRPIRFSLRISVDCFPRPLPSTDARGLEHESKTSCAAWQPIQFL